jgi:hypothetical protein
LHWYKKNTNAPVILIVFGIFCMLAKHIVRTHKNNLPTMRIGGALIVKIKHPLHLLRYVLLHSIVHVPHR